MRRLKTQCTLRQLIFGNFADSDWKIKEMVWENIQNE